MGKRIYTDAQRDEAAQLFAASALDQKSTVNYVAEQIGMSASTVRALAASRGLTKPERKYKPRRCLRTSKSGFARCGRNLNRRRLL